MLRGQHVLIIEALIALDLEQALTSCGAVVNIANTVASALEAVEAPAVTAAIVDLRLHEHSVRDVVERLVTRNLAFCLLYRSIRNGDRGLLAKPASST
jgi:ActR/RegA family two-component response regulator